MAIEIVDFPIKHGGSFNSYVSLPEGIYIYPINFRIHELSMKQQYSPFVNPITMMVSHW